jgi:hypothetical protein
MNAAIFRRYKGVTRRYMSRPCLSTRDAVAVSKKPKPTIRVAYTQA